MGGISPVYAGRAVWPWHHTRATTTIQGIQKIPAGDEIIATEKPVFVQSRVVLLMKWNITIPNKLTILTWPTQLFYPGTWIWKAIPVLVNRNQNSSSVLVSGWIIWFRLYPKLKHAVREKKIMLRWSESILLRLLLEVASEKTSYVGHSPGPGRRAKHTGPVDNKILFFRKK